MKIPKPRKSNLNIRFTHHAKNRLADREVTQSQVRDVVRNSIEIIQSNSNGKFTCFDTPKDPPYSDEEFLVVIYEQTNIEIKVITIMWQDKGGLRANGFNRI